jgi:hypothetical protein
MREGICAASYSHIPCTPDLEDNSSSSTPSCPNLDYLFRHLWERSRVPPPYPVDSYDRWPGKALGDPRSFAQVDATSRSSRLPSHMLDLMWEGGGHFHYNCGIINKKDWVRIHPMQVRVLC